MNLASTAGFLEWFKNKADIQPALLSTKLKQKKEMSLWLLFLDVVSNRLCQLEILKGLQMFSSECCSHMFHTRLEKSHSRHLNCRHCWCGTGSFYSSTFQKAQNIPPKNSVQIPVYPTVQDKQIYLASPRLESSGFEVIQRVWGPPWGEGSGARANGALIYRLMSRGTSSGTESSPRPRRISFFQEYSI